MRVRPLERSENDLALASGLAIRDAADSITGLSRLQEIFVDVKMLTNRGGYKYCRGIITKQLLGWREIEGRQG